MAGYKLKISNSNTKEIVLDTNEEPYIIDGVSFKVNTFDDECISRADDARIEVTISGKITTENREKVKELAKWATDINRQTIYRNIALVVNNGGAEEGTSVVRHYDFESMFVIDYKESFVGSPVRSPKGKNNDSNGDDVGSYTLFIAQRAGKFKRDIFSD